MQDPLGQDGVNLDEAFGGWPEDSEEVDPSVIADLRRMLRDWTASSRGKVSEMRGYLDGSKYRLVSPRHASLSGMSYYAASERLEAGDVLSCAVNTRRNEIMLTDASGSVVGYISGGRGCADDVKAVLGRGSSVYGLVEGRSGGKSGNRNRVHVILVERF